MHFIPTASCLLLARNKKGLTKNGNISSRDLDQVGNGVTPRAGISHGVSNSFAEPEAKERSGFGVQTSQIWRKAQRFFFSAKGTDP